MITLKLDAANRDEAVKKAVDVLLNGGIIAYPTETLYGLGAKYDNEEALRLLYELKQRPREKTIPIIIGSIEQLSLLAESVNNAAADLIARFWPGPLTLVFPARAGLSSFITSSHKIAVRIPGDSFALDLARSAGFPFTATSANISGMPAARNASLVAGYFDDRLDLIIDGGDSLVTEPSTIVDVSGADIVVLREGAVRISRLLSR